MNFGTKLLYLHIIYLGVNYTASLLAKGREFKLDKLKFNVEVLICTDYSIYKLHESILFSNDWDNWGDGNKTSQTTVINHIKAYYTQIINDVNTRYKVSFDEHSYFDMNIVISDFLIATDKSESSWTSKYILPNSTSTNTKINGDLALVEFNSWIEKNRGNVFQFDHAFGVTAYDIISKDQEHDYNGLAYVYGICKKFYSGSLIEDKGAFESTRSFAHELAHNLGAEHDGGDSECSEWDNYIMAPKYLSYNQKNSWLFSNCTINKIKEFLISSENNFCLMDTAFDLINGTDIPKSYPGQVYDASVQCKLLHGNDSTPCFEYKDSFCESLYCHSNSSSSVCVWLAPAAEGTDCEADKWCEQGKCVPKPYIEEEECVEDLNIVVADYLHKTWNISCIEGIQILMEKFNKNQDEACHELQNECCKTCQRKDLFKKEPKSKKNESYDNAIANEAKPEPDLINNDNINTKCVDLMDQSFCEKALENDICDHRFFWNGRSIAEWCGNYCSIC